ncbi:HAD domain-containing protein [Allonocardiopsis opalescens]|uniref:Secreted protein n=1 Tax=Allonocardiopsis opalescens TaxID=1144618 RepID=A0A2T0PM76_9ACTN|nr:HAD domain-containing protein [Allonocardiopsis opalescens]PRX90020.1 hypothetical protein CLV72_11910 [Allonocardiopsis opalescens]
MVGSGRLPLLFLDVDGPLIPFGAEWYPAFRVDGGPRDGGSNPLLDRVDPGHGRRLAALPCEPVWATTWLEDANVCVAPRLGLPRLDVVVWPEPSDTDERDARAGLHWKTRTLVEWAAGRPFAWVDDEITAADRDWVSAHHRGSALLHRVDPRRGLTDADYAAVDRWARTAAGAVPPHGAV